jgi:uncharacterized protein (DUF779 family)
MINGLAAWVDCAAIRIPSRTTCTWYHVLLVVDIVEGHGGRATGVGKEKRKWA